MISTNFKKICCSFAENKIFENSKMTATMAGTFCEITILNLNLISVMETD